MAVKAKKAARKPARKSSGASGIHDIIDREVASLRSERARLSIRLNEIDARLSGLRIARDTLNREGYSPPVGRKRVIRRKRSA